MKLRELIFSDEYSHDTDISNIEISHVSTRVNEITSNTLFIVIKSIKFDINKIINKVLDKKPAAILCEDCIEIHSNKIPILRCLNTRKMLSIIYSRFYKIDFNKVRFIAVTGTNGKTTTSTMLTHILEYSGNKVGFIGTGKIIICGKQISSSSYSMTTPDPEYLYWVIKMMQDSGCEFIVMEVSSHALFFEKTAPIPFEISIFTNLSSEHLDFHASLEEYFNTKMKLFSQTELGIFNFDDEYSHKAYINVCCKKSGIGIVNKADAVAIDIKLLGLSGSEYTYRNGDILLRIKLSLGGDFNIYNSMMAAHASIELGISAKDIEAALSELDCIDGRLEIINDEITVIIDYAHTENAFEKMLKFLFSTKNAEQNLIVVFGCGGERDKLKRPKMGAAAEKYSSLAIVTSDNSRGESESEIIEDILSGFKSTNKRLVITSRASAIEYAILNAKKNDIVAIIGKGHERYNCDKTGIHAFDEREIIKKALIKRRENL